MQQIFRMKDAAGNEYDVPNSDLAEFSGAVKDAQPVNRYRDADGNSYDVPASDIQEFRAAVPSHEQVRTMTFADGSKRDFTLPELDKFLRSKEWREGEAYKADRDERDRIVAERVAPDGERSGFLGELSRRLLSAEGIRENAEDSSLAKPYAYLNDLANSLVSGILGAGSKITEAAGHAIGDNAVGRALVEEGRAGQQTLRRALPTDMLDTSGGGVVDKVLQTGKGVASVTGEFAPAMLSGVGPAYAAGVVSSGAVNRSAEVYEAATANGYSPVEANALAMGAGAVDAVQNMLLMGSFKGIWKGAEKTAADAVKRSLVKKLTVDTLKTGATMGAGAAAQDVVNQAAGIDEKGNVAEPTDYSWTRTAKAGAEGFLEGGMFHLVNSAAHALPKAIAWEGEAKTMSAQASRDALETPEGRSLVMLNSPKAAEAILDARLKGKDVSRKMLRALGIHDEVAPSVADRNALADALVKDYAAYQKFLAGKPEPSKTSIEIPDEALKPPKEATNETRNGADEAPAKPAEGTAGEPKVGEAADAKAAEPPRAEAPREGVVEPPAAAEPPKTPQEPPKSAEVGEATPEPEKPVEAVSAAPAATAVPDGKGKMKKRKGKEAKAEEPPPPVEEQTVPAEAPTSAEAVRDSMRNDPELQRIDAAYKAAKTDAERNALKAKFEERVEELKTSQKPTEAEPPAETPAAEAEAPAAEAPSKPPHTKEGFENLKNRIAAGKPVKITGFPAGEALALKDGKEWIVIDSKSGLRFGRGRTRKDAIADAEVEIKEHSPEQLQSAIRKGRADFETSRDAYEPKASDLAADAELRKDFDKTVKSALGQEGSPIDNLHDAAERLIDTIADKYDGDANVEKALDKALSDFKENHPLGRGIKPSESAEYFKEFADELAKKYDIPGYDGKVDAPKYGGREMKVGNVDSIQKKLFELRGEYADTSVIEEGAFDELPFREIDAKKFSARDLKELKRLEKAASDVLFDIDMDGIEFEKSGVLADESRKLVDAYTEARDNLNRFLEQADRYQHLKRDKKGRPLFSLSAPAKETVADTIADLDRIIASEEAGKPSGGETAAEGLPASSKSWAPGKGVSRVKAFFGGLVSKNSVVRAIKDTFPEFAVRGKNTTRIGASYSGHFEPWRELVRSKDMADIDTIPHEIGHGISMRTKRRMMNIPQEAKRDLARMGRELYGSKKPNGGYMEEGWAEYIRGYMTGADDLATQAPHLDKWFREKFAEAHPDYVRKIDRIRKEIMRYRLQSDLQRAAAEQNPETSAMRRAWEKVEDFFSAENWDDEGATLTRGYEKSGLAEMHKWQGEMRELEKLYKKGQGNSPRAAELQKSIEEKILTDPRIFASNARGTSKARTLDMMKYGITNITGTEKIGDVTGFDANGNAIRNNNTESYRDIFGNFTSKELKQWDLYAAAKIGLENYVKKGKEFGVDKAALERRVAALENPKFLDALDRFTKMSRRALSVGLEAGALTPEQYQKIVGEHQYYVRTERRLAEDGAGGGRSQSNPIHKIKGSTKNIMPPRVATMMQIEKQLRYFQTMKVLNMLAKDVRKAEVANDDFYKTGNGREYQVAANLPVQVANAQEAVKFGSEKLRKDLTKKMVDTGAATDKAAADALFDQLFNDGADQLTVFRERPSKGKNGLVSTYIDGKLVTFELPDAKWAKYITGMESGFDNGPSGKVWDSITAPSKLLRFGATTAHPAFATANFVRDTYHSAIMSETGAKPLVSSVIGMLNDVMGMDAGRLFKQMGGEMSMLMGSSKETQFKHLQNAALADNILKQVAADTSLVNPLSGVLRVYTDILSKPEMGPRVREVMGVMKRGQAAGLSREASAWLAFAAGKDISMDFGKHGKYMKVLNQVLPYTNAWYRGLEQFARNMGLKKALPTQFEDRQGVRAMRTAGRGMLYLSATAVANSIANMLMMDEKERRAEFNKTPREKWEYDDILGTVRVPLPFELGAVFYAIPKAIVYEAFGDKGAVKEAIWHGLSTNLGKYSNVEDFTSGITVIAPFVDMLRNKKWDKSPLVSPHIMDAYPKDRQKWYDYSTTEAAKWVGEKMNWAPAHIDHVANTWTGGMWKRLLSPAADTTLATQTGASTFIPRPTARRDVHEFYDSRSELQSHYNAGSASVEDVGKLARANKLQEKLSPLFKEARELAANEPDKAERRKKREAIMDKAFDLIHEFNVAEADDRKGGLAHAADALTRSAEIEPSVREKNLAVLKNASYDEIKAALRAYGKEKLPVAVKNKAGFKTGRIKYERRWSDETIRLRIRRLYKEFHGEE